jgi:hypothetical protein
MGDITTTHIYSTMPAHPDLERRVAGFLCRPCRGWRGCKWRARSVTHGCSPWARLRRPNRGWGGANCVCVPSPTGWRPWLNSSGPPSPFLGVSTTFGNGVRTTQWPKRSFRCRTSVAHHSPCFQVSRRIMFISVCWLKDEKRAASWFIQPPNTSIPEQRIEAVVISWKVFADSAPPKSGETTRGEMES